MSNVFGALFGLNAAITPIASIALLFRILSNYRFYSGKRIMEEETLRLLLTFPTTCKLLDPSISSLHLFPGIYSSHPIH